MTSRRSEQDAAADGDEQTEHRVPTFLGLESGSDGGGLFDHDAGVAGGLDHEDPGAERDRLVRPGVELHRLPADGDAHLAVAAAPGSGSRPPRGGRPGRRGSGWRRCASGRPPGPAPWCRSPTGSATATPATSADDEREQAAAGERGRRSRRRSRTRRRTRRPRAPRTGRPRRGGRGAGRRRGTARRRAARRRARR